jgi:hypothetical protein
MKERKAMKRLWLLAIIVAFCGAAFGQAPVDGDEYIWIRTADGTAIKSAAHCFDAGTGDVRCYQDMREVVGRPDFGTSSGGTESGQYLVGRERCNTAFLSAAYEVGASVSLEFKVEFSDAAATTPATGYVLGGDYQATTNWVVIGTWSASNTGIVHTTLATLENNTGTATHGVSFVQQWPGYRYVRLLCDGDVGVDKWVSIWVSAQ